MVTISGIGGSFLIIAMASWISSTVYDKPDLSSVLKIMAITLPIYALSVVWLAATRGVKLMQYTVYVRKVAVPGILILGAAVTFLIGYAKLGLPIAYTTAIIMGCFGAWISQKRVFGTQNSDSRSAGLLRILLEYSLPLMLAKGLQITSSRLDIILLGGIVIAEEIGIYNVNVQASLLVGVLLIAFTTMFAPMAAEYWHRGEKLRLVRLYKTVTRWQFTIALALTAMTIIFSQEILMLFGPQFVRTANILIIMSIARLIHSSTGPSNSLIIMAGYSRIGLFNAILQIVVTIFFLLWMVPIFGILGAAIAFLMSNLIGNLAYLAEVVILLRMHPYEVSFLKPIIATVLASGGVLIIQRNFEFPDTFLRTLILLSLFVFFFIGTLYLIKFEDAELTVLRTIRRRIAGKVYNS